MSLRYYYLIAIFDYSVRAAFLTRLTLHDTAQWELPKRFTTTRVHLPTRFRIAERKRRQDFQHIIYRTFGTTVVLKMPACPDRIRTRAHIMKWFLFSENNCGFIKTAVIAVIFQNRRRTRARKPHT